MIKTRINNEYKDIIKIFGGGALQKEITKVWSREAQKYVYESEVEYTGTLPITITADGNALLDYRIYGNTEQSGTSTPENPIMPVGVGERTENLFDIDNVVENYYLSNGVPTEYHIGDYVLSDYISIASNTATISAKVVAQTNSGAHWAVYDENKSFIRGGLAFTAKFAPTIKVIDTSGAAFIRVDYALECLTDCMLNLGSTPLPYEPYGYKIPLTVNNTEYPIYLGEVETTRKIKKLVFTGEENWSLNNNKLMFHTEALGTFNYESAVCTHYINAKSFTEVFTTMNSIAIIISGIYVNSGHANVADFRSYLAAQYAEGTPVTVWYVLVEPETAVVNEPLMKIGDYADTIDSTQATVQIPTFAGTTVIDYDGELKPSQMYIKYRR